MYENKSNQIYLKQNINKDEIYFKNVYKNK